MTFTNSLLNKYAIFAKAPKNLDTPITTNIRELQHRDELFKKEHGRTGLTTGTLFFTSVIAEWEPCDEQGFGHDRDMRLLIAASRSNTHVFQIEDDALGLITKTDAKEQFLHLPYSIMFIDNNILLNNVTLRGLYIIEPYEPETTDKILCVLSVVQLPNGTTTPFYMDLLDTTGNEISTTHKELFRTLPIKSFVQSLLSFLHDPEIIQTRTEHTTEEIVKRNKRGQIGKTSTTKITLTGQKKQYIENIRKLFPGGTINWQHSFWVRGHYRKLQSPRYKTKKDCIIWVPPFIKGHGELLKKDYLIKQRTGAQT